MNDKIIKAVKTLAVGLIFVMVNLELEYKTIHFNIIPQFPGYFLIYLASKDFFEGEKAKRYGVLAMVCFFVSLLSFTAGLMGFKLGVVGIVIDMIHLLGSMLLMFVVFHRLSEIAIEAENEKAVFFRVIMVGYIATYIAQYLTGILFQSQVIYEFLGMILLILIIFALVMVFRFARELERMV